MFDRLTKLWKLLKKRLTKPQKKVFAEKIKKHKAKVAKIKKDKKSFLLKMKEKKGAGLKATTADKDRFAKFKKAERKENLAMEKTAKKLMEIVLQKALKRTEYLRNIAAKSRESAKIFNPVLQNLKGKRAEYKAQLEKTTKEKKDFARPIAARKKKQGANFVMRPDEKSKLTSFIRREARYQKQIGHMESLMKTSLRERMRYTKFAEQIDTSVTKLEKGMKRFKMVSEAPIKYRESTEQLATVIKERDSLIEKAISNSEKLGKLGLKFTEEEKPQISDLKGKEAKLKAVQTRSQKIVALDQKIRARAKERASLQPTPTPRRRPSSKKDRGIN